MEKERKNVILADCEAEEVLTFKQGLEAASGMKFAILSNVCNRGHGSVWKQAKRYGSYFAFPFRIFCRRRRYGVIVGWQQFYANIFAFYCHLFRVRKSNTVVSVNYTYKRKGGLLGGIYSRFMRFAVNNRHMDHLHVLSGQYANRCAAELGVDRNRFLVTTFGIPDEWDRWRDCALPQLPRSAGTKPGAGYVLSIGRSNRDFDFLTRVWARPEMADIPLVLIADTYRPRQPLSANVIHLTDVTGEASKPWMARCALMVLPIADGNLASGDTVLLTGMQFEKTVVITRPSTLAEMYITDGEDGVALEKDEEPFAAAILRLMGEDAERRRIGRNARKKYLERFSRHAMGAQIGRIFGGRG